MFKSLKDLLRPVYAQSLFVFAAFAVMAGASYFFGSVTERNHLIRNVNDAIANTQAQIASELREPKTALGVISETVRDMILHNYSSESVHKYFVYISDYLQSGADDHMRDALGCYGLFDVYDGLLMTGNESYQIPEDFDPGTRPWYITAVEAAGDVGITDPYIDEYSKKYVITFENVKRKEKILNSRLHKRPGLSLGYGIGSESI